MSSPNDGAAPAVPTTSPAAEQEHTHIATTAPGENRPTEPIASTGAGPADDETSIGTNLQAASAAPAAPTGADCTDQRPLDGMYRGRGRDERARVHKRRPGRATYLLVLVCIVITVRFVPLASQFNQSSESAKLNEAKAKIEQLTVRVAKIEQLTAELASASGPSSESEAELNKAKVTIEKLTAKLASASGTSSENTVKFQVAEEPPKSVQIEMQERVSTYNDYCGKQSDPSTTVTIPDFFLTSKQDNLAACLPMKTGSSSWFHIFYCRRFPDPPLRPGDGNWTFIARMDKMISESDITSMTSRRQKPDKSSYEMFITVRHPLTRLYSGWNEHMRWINRETKVGMQWKQFYLTENDADLATNHTCSWPKFAELFASSKYEINAHHQPLSQLCGRCLFNWNYIVKQETFNRDSQFLVDKFFDGNATVVRRNAEGSSRDPLRALANYCQFSDERIAAIEEYYEADYHMYGYEKFNRSLVCNE